jgi:hypothetical protein
MPKVNPRSSPVPVIPRWASRVENSLDQRAMSQAKHRFVIRASRWSRNPRPILRACGTAAKAARVRPREARQGKGPDIGRTEKMGRLFSAGRRLAFSLDNSLNI